VTPEAFDSWWESNGRRLALCYLHRAHQTRDEIDELLGAVYLGAVQRLEGYDESRSALSTWMSRVCFNVVRDSIREQRTRESFEYPCGFIEDAGPDDRTPNERVMAWLAEIDRFLAKFSEADRQMIVWHALGDNQGTANAYKIRLSRARRVFV
jgi:DNA-directed RNA polymerase specialized sigma24 family protein